MKGKRFMGLALATAMLAGSIGGVAMTTGAADETDKVPLIAWYNAPAETWESEATPLGNGFIGGMVFGGVENDRIQINEHTLWSGGPGANQNFDGGANGKKETIHQALQDVREKLQETMTKFTETQSAKVVNGQVQAHNYSASAEINTLLQKLKGEKTNFGSYQTLGNLNLIDPAFVTAMLAESSSPDNPLDGGESTANLFDGSDSTKFFAGNGTRGNGATAPYVIEWSYTDVKKVDSYKISSANDMEGRDPYQWTLEGSNDGETYTVIDEQDKQTFRSRHYTLSFKLAEPVEYQYFRLTVTKTLQNLPVQLSEIELVDSSTQLKQEYTDYTRSLDLDNGMATVCYTIDDVTYTREYFISNPGNVMVVRLSANKPGMINRLVSITSEQTKKTISVNGDTISMVGQPSDHRTGGLQFAQQVKVIPTGGTATGSADGVMIRNADSALIVMSCGTNYQQCMDDTYDYFSEEDPMIAVAERVEAAAKKSYDELLAAHQEDYKALFGAVDLNLGYTAMPTNKTTARLLVDYKTGSAKPEERRYLETLYYQFGRYLLIGSSREGSLPANLQGIWAEGMNPPWSADYHTNINVQMNYWLAQQTNLEECHMPVIDYINAQVARGTETAQLYHCTQDGEDVRGWTMYHENNIWGNTMPAVSDAFYFPAGAAWMCQDIWEYYAFTLDEEFLAKNFDTLLGAAIFWVDNLWEDERDGTLVSSPSYSPEHGPYSLGASCDQEIIWELFTEVIKAAQILEISDETRVAQVEEVKAALEKLYMPKVGLSGIFLEWKDETALDISGDGGHRHVNQLYALHPGTYVVAGRSEWDNDMVEAMKKVLTIRGDGGTGWSKAWKINFWARLRDGNHAGVMVSQILKESTLNNLFDTHPPFQIDGNFGATAGMTEMLLQSQGTSIDLLPALPDDWATGYVTGLRARGNFTVDMEWADKALVSATVVSEAGADCTMNFADIDNATIVDEATGKEVELTKNENGSVTFATEKGATYVITFEDAGLLGDVDSNEKVNTTDARLMLQYAANLIDENGLDLSVADVNFDDKVNTSDARRVLQYSAGIIDKFE